MAYYWLCYWEILGAMGPLAGPPRSASALSNHSSVAVLSVHLNTRLSMYFCIAFRVAIFVAKIRKCRESRLVSKEERLFGGIDEIFFVTSLFVFEPREDVYMDLAFDAIFYTLQLVY